MKARWVRAGRRGVRTTSPRLAARAIVKSLSQRTASAGPCGGGTSAAGHGALLVAREQLCDGDHGQGVGRLRRRRRTSARLVAPPPPPAKRWPHVHCDQSWELNGPASSDSRVRCSASNVAVRVVRIHGPGPGANGTAGRRRILCVEGARCGGAARSASVKADSASPLAATGASLAPPAPPRRPRGQPTSPASAASAGGLLHHPAVAVGVTEGEEGAVRRAVGMDARLFGPAAPEGLADLDAATSKLRA